MNLITDLSQLNQCEPLADISPANSTPNGTMTMSHKTITNSKAFKSLESVVTSHHGEVELLNELETIAIDAPRGMQWIETGTATVQRSRSNGTHNYTREACSELLEIADSGIEPASEDTIDAMGW